MPYEIGAGFDDLISGDDELSGDEIVGALVKAGVSRPKANKFAALASQMKAAQQPGIVASNSLRMLGERPLAIPLTSVAANTTTTLQALPQQVYRPERLVYTGPASTFSIVDVQIAQRSQFAGAGALAADGFAPNAVGVRLTGDTLQANQPAFVTVQNLTGAPANFSGFFVGSTAA